MEEMLFFDHSDPARSTVLWAKSGRLLGAETGKLGMVFYEGTRHEQYRSDSLDPGSRLSRMYFDSLRLFLPLPEQRGSMEAYRDHSSRPRGMLAHAIDSLQWRLHALDNRLAGCVAEVDCEAIQAEQTWTRKALARHRYAFADMHALPLSCAIYLLVGLTLGVRVQRRGRGLALPALAAVSMFLVFYLLKAQGEQLAAEGSLHPVWAAWLPELVFVPPAMLLAWQAMQGRF
jgi:hypothetical protein